MTKTSRQLVEHTRTLILEEEEKAEKFINYWRLGLSFFFFLITYIISSEIPVKSIYALTLGASIYLLFSLFMLFYLRSGGYRPFIKYLNVFVDIALLTWVIWTFGTFRTFKNQAFLLYFMWIALGSMRFSFKLTLFAGALCVLSYTGLMGLALLFRTIELGTITESYTTGRVSILKEFVKIIYLVLVTVALSFGSKSYVRMADKARDQQLDAERQRMKAQKLESIGFLAGGLAHDFNNILAVIMNNLHIIKANAADRDKVLLKVDDAVTATGKATALTRQLLTFSMGGAPSMKTMPAQKILKEAARLSLTGSSIKCDTSGISGDLMLVKVDEGQINQVINNLLINAVQASPAGSTVQIDASNLDIKDGSPVPLPPGHYIHIRITDQGHGIQQDNLTRIFDPYFSTKAAGSGLGLATAYSIIRRHGGHISVESEPGKGTAFHIYLSASDEEYVEEARPEKAAYTGKLKILVMDDEQEFLDSIGEALMLSGHQVSFAREGVEAVDRYMSAKDGPDAFDIVVMDLTISGGMGGAEAVRLLKDNHPEAMVIVSSGYSNDPVMSDYKGYGFNGILPKPFTMDQLESEIGRVIALNNQYTGKIR
jgi:signal transduction histidine kinase/CheY-like chemotaxis protein